MSQGQFAGRLLVACSSAAVWAALAEASTLAVFQQVPPASLVWLAAATWSLSVLALLPLTALVASPRPLRKWASAGLPGWAAPLGGGLLVLSGALHVVNVRLYYGLYFGAHVSLSLATLLFALLGCALAVPARIAARAEGRLFVFGVLGLWFVLAAASVAKIALEPGLRAHALEQGTLLQHELLAFDRLFPVLAAEDEQPVEIDPALRAALAPLPMSAPSGELRGKNVLLVTVDSMRADRLRAGGSPRIQLPAMEALADLGVPFTRAYAPSCWTVHSMSALLYQRLPSLLSFTPVGVNEKLQFLAFPEDSAMVKNPMNMKRTTPVPLKEQGPGLVDALRAAGYRTATVPAYIFYLRAAGLTADFEVVDEEAFKSTVTIGSAIAPVAMVERAAKFLDSLDGSAPFFLWLHFMDAHDPYEARDQQAEGQGREARYDSELRFVDAQVAALRGELEQRGLDADTLWILHADHGEEFGDHGGDFHARTLYDETVRVPLVIRLPTSVQRGVRGVDVPVSLLDLPPTLLDALGIASAAPMMGRSLWPTLLRGQPLAAHPLLMECERFMAKKRALVQWPFKLIVDRQLGTAQLYALEGDPGERHNLADREPALLQLMLNGLSQAERILALP